MENIGIQIDQLELQGLFEAEEGEIELIYGRIGNGKTTEAVRRMIDSLANGRVVYSNIMLDLDLWNFDDRSSIWTNFVNLLAFRKRYYKFDKSNYHYFNPDDYENIDDLVSWLNTLTDCEIYYDEGQWLLNSYEGMKYSKDKMKLALHTRHYNRLLVLITQRPTAIQVSARVNVNRFYKCQKILNWPFMVLRVTEFQEMTAETVDEQTPVSRKFYIANKKMFNTFNSLYLRGGIQRSQDVNFEAFDLTLWDKIKLLGKQLSDMFRRS